MRTHNFQAQARPSWTRTACLFFLMFCAACLFTASSVQAAEKEGGFKGPGPKMTTVEKAGKMQNGAKVALKGKVTKHVDDDKYEFQDNTGLIILDIDDDLWLGQDITPDDVVVVYGEIDQDLNEVLEIDIYNITEQ